VTADPLDAFPAFAAAVRARLEHGRVTFGETGFAREPSELVGGIREELLDVCGWSFVLASRIDAIGAALGEQPSAAAGDEPPAPQGRPSVRLPGFTPETLALLAELSERLRMPPGQVVALALRTLVAALEQRTVKPARARRLPSAERALPSNSRS
jgi:hypothetical protein